MKIRLVLYVVGLLQVFIGLTMTLPAFCAWYYDESALRAILLSMAVSVLANEGRKIQLTVAGEPWDGDSARWTDMVNGLGLSEIVDLRLGYQPDSVVTELIASHHGLLAPYRSATQSGVVAQALAAGRPVIATRVGGLPDAVHEGKNGTLAAPNSVAALASAIGRFEADLERLADGAALTKTSWASVATALVGSHRPLVAHDGALSDEAATGRQGRIGAA